MKKLIFFATIILFFSMNMDMAAAEEPATVITKENAEFHYYNEGTGEMDVTSIPKGISLPVISIEAEKVNVNWDGMKGYILKEFVLFSSMEDSEEPETKPAPEKATAFFQAKGDIPVYLKENDQFIKRARLLNEEKFKQIGEEGNYYKIQFGYFTGFVKKSEVTPVYDAKLPGGVEKGTAPPRNRVITLDTVNLYYSSNHQLVSFGRIEKGLKLPLVAQHRSYYIVEIAGRKAYIKKADVSLYTGNYVNPKVQNYTYEQMLTDFKELTTWYPDYTELHLIGRSVDGRRIYALKLGKGKEEVFLNGSHHAREHMTTNVLMEMIDSYAYAYQQNHTIDGYKVRNMLDKTSIWFVPMVNPDGVTLVQKGHKSAKNPSKVLKLNKNSTNFSAWKANIRGVDLNRQYPADWKNICCDPGKPGPNNYKGPKPLSEPEAQALYNFTLEHTFKNAAAYHSSGRIIYWHFKQGWTNTKRDKALAMKISKKTGYSLVPAQRNPSGGGYTDWFIQSQKRPGFTPEISPYVGNRPVPLKNFDQVWKENYSIGLLLANEPM